MRTEIVNLDFNKKLYYLGSIILPLLGIGVGFISISIGGEALILLLVALMLLLSPFGVLEEMSKKQGKAIENLFQKIDGFNPTFIIMSSSLDSNTTNYECVTGLDENSYQIAVSHLKERKNVEIKIYSLKEIQEPDIKYNWEDFVVKKRNLSTPGATIGAIYGGLPGAIGGALLASSKSFSKNKTLRSLSVKLNLTENFSNGVDVPLFVAATPGWEFDDSDTYRKETKSKLDLAVRFANHLKSLFQNRTKNQDNENTVFDTKPATKELLGISPLKDEKIIFKMPCRNRKGLFYVSDKCSVILTDKRLVLRDRKKDKRSYTIAMTDLKKATFTESILKNLKIKTEKGAFTVEFNNEKDQSYATHKIKTYVNNFSNTSLGAL